MPEINPLNAVDELQHLLKGVNGSPSLAMLNIVLTDTLGIAMHDAVTTQRNAQILNSAITTAICTRIIAVNRNKRPARAIIPTPPALSTVNSKQAASDGVTLANEDSQAKSKK